MSDPHCGRMLALGVIVLVGILVALVAQIRAYRITRDAEQRIEKLLQFQRDRDEERERKRAENEALWRAIRNAI